MADDEFVFTIGEDEDVDIESSDEEEEEKADPVAPKRRSTFLAGLVSEDEDDPYAPAPKGGPADSDDDGESSDDVDSEASDSEGEVEGAAAGAGAAGSEDDDDEEEEEEEEDNDDEDEDDDDDDDEDEDVSPKPTKGKKEKSDSKVEGKKKAKAAATTRVRETKAAVKVDEEALPDFSELHLSRPLLLAVSQIGYVKPTAIQAKAIPHALAGKDICGSAQTGSGKTAAFLLPALERLLFRDKRTPAIRVVVLLPTRELATQCHRVCQGLAQFTDVRSALVVGGMSSKLQEAELRSRPDIVIGTPGRLIDHLHNSHGVHFDNVDILVMDEADRLLEMGFTEEVQEVTKACPVERQTLFFSATMTTKVEELVKFTLKKPVRVSADPVFDVATKLSQEFIRIRKSREEDREAILMCLLTGPFRQEVIVFFDRKAQAHRMMILLDLFGFSAGELHGNLTQQQRLDAFTNFAKKEIDVLVATDLAGRGLDIKDVKTVINFEMPRDLTTYTHRVGRTARAGRHGHAVTLTGENRRVLMKDVVKHAKGSVKNRTLDPTAVEDWRDKIKAMQPKVIQRFKQERLEKEARLADQEATRVRNLIEHEDDIMSRPQRTWFQSSRDKLAMKDATKAAADAVEAKVAKLSARERKALRNAKVLAEKKSKASKEKAHPMTRKKRRRMEATEADAPNALTKVARNMKSIAKNAKKAARLAGAGAGAGPKAKLKGKKKKH